MILNRDGRATEAYGDAVNARRNEYLTVGRPSSQRAPAGARHQYEYNNPNFVPSSNFNFWKDINTNVVTRADWDNNNLASKMPDRQGSVGILDYFYDKHDSATKRGAKSVQRERSVPNLDVAKHLK